MKAHCFAALAVTLPGADAAEPLVPLPTRWSRLCSGTHRRSFVPILRRARTMQTFRLSTPFLILTAAAPCLAQTTWYVSSAPGSLTMQAAISAASPGDRIEVINLWSMPSFLLDKGLDITTVYQTTAQTIEVVGVPAGQRARIGGFRSENVSVRNCAGTVLIEDVWASSTATTPLPPPALDILGSAAVFVSRCNFTGHHGTLAGSPAIRIDGSQVFLNNGAYAIGGRTISQTAGVGDSGCTGVEVVSGDVMIGNYHIEGGDGYGGTIVGGAGGTALHVLSGQVLVSASELWAGSGGQGPTNGTNGFAALGNLRRTADTALLFGPSPGVVTVPARPHLSLYPTSWQLMIVVGDPSFNPSPFLFLGLDIAHGHVPVPAFDGDLALTTNAVLTVVPILGSPYGYGSLTLQLPPAPGGYYNLNVFAQGLADVGGALVLTAPAAARIP